MFLPFTASFIIPVVTSTYSGPHEALYLLNIFTYGVAFLNPVMFFVIYPYFKRDLWHLIKCHYIKKEGKMFIVKNPSVSFSKESHSPPGPQLKLQPFDDFSKPVYASTPTLKRAEVCSMPLENNSEVACVKVSMVPTAVGQLSKVEKERKSSPFASPLSSNPIFENTDAQSASSFDQGRKNLSGLSCSVVFSQWRIQGRDPGGPPPPPLIILGPN